MNTIFITRISILIFTFFLFFSGASTFNRCTNQKTLFCGYENNLNSSGFIATPYKPVKTKGEIAVEFEKVNGRCFDPTTEKCNLEKRNKIWIICPLSSSFCAADNGRMWTCCSQGRFCNSTVSSRIPICDIENSSQSHEKRSIKMKVQKKEEYNHPFMQFVYQPEVKRQTVFCNCPTFLNCCADQCYSESAYRCLNRTGGGVLLCPTGTEICGDGCYRRELFRCVDERLIMIVNGTSSNGIGGGAIAGIVIGGLVFLILLVALTIFLVLYFKSKQTKKEGFDSMLLNDMQVGEVIGRGYFGEVYKGTWNGTVVALKTIKKDGADDDGRRWREEIVLLHELNHPNIVRLLGIYLTAERMFMVVEYAENGALDVFLRKKSNADRLSNNDLLLMAFDLAKGMMYLKAKGIIHRDLAARNLLLDSSLRVKISDFGMSRHGKIYQATSREIPYRWAAPEVFLKNQSFSESDVWSFAVCLWEIFTLGATPYEGHSNKELAKMIVEDNLRLEKPARSSPSTFELMLECWALNPEDRPSFQEIYQRMMATNIDVLSSHEDRVYQKQFGNTPVIPRTTSKRRMNGPPKSTVIASPKIVTSFNGYSHSQPYQPPQQSGATWSRNDNSDHEVRIEGRKRDSIDQERVPEVRIGEIPIDPENITQPNYENSVVKYENS